MQSHEVIVLHRCLIEFEYCNLHPLREIPLALKMYDAYTARGYVAFYVAILIRTTLSPYV